MSDDTDDPTRVLADQTAERFLLGAVLLGGHGVLNELDDARFDPDDYYAPKHGDIHHAAQVVASRREPVDVVTVAAQLGPDLTRIGGPAYLAELLAGTVPASATHYAAIVTRWATRRALVAAGTRITTLAHSADGDDAALVDAAQGCVVEISDRVNGTVKAGAMTDALDDVLDRLQHGGSPATATGITDVDRLLVGGLQEGTLTVIAGRPGTGKTVVGLQVALNIATGGGNVGFTSLEMTRQDLLMRAVSSMSSVDYGRMQRSPHEVLSESEWRAVSKAAEEIRKSGLAISHRTSATVAAVRSDIRAMIRTRGSCAAWVVDYLQLVSPADRRLPREQQVAALTRALKGTALELGVPVLVLAQLNREGEKSGRPPVITDLRESGAIEQDSDNVILLHRAEDHPDLLGLHVAKNRRGPIAGTSLLFEGSFQRVSARPWTPSGVLGSGPRKAAR